MPQYNLEQLGPTGFQDLASALAIATFGPVVQKMGAGRDGGRDMYAAGTMVWGSTDDHPRDVWSGYSVLQVKHRATPATRPEENASWLWGQVRGELSRWADPAGDRPRVPDQMLFITNVGLSPFPGSGGHDSISREIARYIEKLDDGTRDIDEEAAAERILRLARLRKIKSWRFWDRAQVEALLDAHAGVRRAFPAFLTAGDVFANLGAFTDRLPLEYLEPGLKTHARSSLAGDGQIYFDEAGSGDAKGFHVHEVATDLPITLASGRKHPSAVRYVLQRAEHVLKPKFDLVSRPRHVILTGPPGNGKTTLSKYLVQIFRASMLNMSEGLSAGQQDIIDGTATSLGRLGLDLPLHRRWPMRIDLAEYAQEGGLESDSTLLRWIALKVSKRLNDGEITASMLDSWMKQWSWFLVLDGLDEVTEPDTRKRLIRQVTEFAEEAEASNCDMFVLLTTRPVGYTENIAPTLFERVDLDALALSEAIRYGKVATRVRLHDDVDRIDRIVHQLELASKDENLRNLLRTPLQVLILTIIIDGAGQVAPDRFSLFWNYYQTVFRRERAKIGGFHQLLQDNDQQILELHLRVGFELQSRSEQADRSFATLSVDELRMIASDVLREDGFDPVTRNSLLLDNILAAAMSRLVLIVPRGDEGYGFDVRSLQELTAAMYITSGPVENVVRRLRILAPSPHWRNTWIFAAGRWFSERQQHLHEALVDLIETVDSNAPTRLSKTVPIGPRLALEIIDDGMARAYPRRRDQIAKQAFKVLDEPLSSDLAITARIMMRFAETGEEQASIASGSIRDALSSSIRSAATARRVQELISTLSDELGFTLRSRALSRALPRQGEKAPASPAVDWELFNAEIDTAPLTPHQFDRLKAARMSLLEVLRFVEPSSDQVSPLLSALDDSEVARVFERALLYVAGGDDDLAIALRDKVLPYAARQALSAQLRDTF